MLLVSFRIIEVSSDEKFLDVNIEKAEISLDKVILRASHKGKPIFDTKEVNGKTYTVIQIEDKSYLVNNDM